jgi:hypothetical protein
MSLGRRSVVALPRKIRLLDARCQKHRATSELPVIVERVMPEKA